MAMIIADLHIHSRYSRATAKSLDPEHLHLAAQLKGIDLLGTGDLTHPQWLEELEEKLEEDGEGAYRLKPELAREVEKEVPASCRRPVRFVLSGEISSIYKRHGKTRKVHNLVLLPDFDAAERLQTRLDALGNIRSDGRPILGLDSRDLLEICLEVEPGMIFIPAHIWTPWFSLFGSKSGFDAIEECFDDLTGHIHALETGLSSDPPMNWRLSALDRFALTSNSDAHSPAKLAREANLIDGPPTYQALHQALGRPGGNGMAGTLEFFPDEGKYHLDGHRKCGLRLSPKETKQYGGRCPKCGGLITVGVLSRVDDLADRPEGYKRSDKAGFESLVPLHEVASEVLGKGPATKTVARLVDAVVAELGPELFVLREASLEEIGRVGGGLLAEAVRRVRTSEVNLEGGYDGEFGHVSIFTPDERQRLIGQKGLWVPGALPTKPRAVKKKTPAPERAAAPLAPEDATLSLLDPVSEGLTQEQRRAVEYSGGHLVVRAGPGSGKTRVLARRVASLLNSGVEPERVAAVTFTRKAAGEMRHRINQISAASSQVWVGTFHALGREVLGELRHGALEIVDEDQRLEIIKGLDLPEGLSPARAASMLSLAKQRLEKPDDPALAGLLAAYEAALAEVGLLDLDDLVHKAVRALTDNRGLAARWRWRFRHILVDEYQDVNPVQVDLLKALCAPVTKITAIGDPDQAIYGFRGADRTRFTAFTRDFGHAGMLPLSLCFRNSPAILAAAQGVMAADQDPQRAELTSDGGLAHPVVVCRAVSPKAEAIWVAEQIIRLTGGLDSRQAEGGDGAGQYSAGDFAVLYRLHSQAKVLSEVLEQAGIPVQVAAEEPLAETEALDFTAQRVSLLSLHAAKGLEFSVVFVVGAEERLLPYEPPGRDPAEAAEEHRLFYVGMTRAAQRLFISRAAKRSLYGKTYSPGPSPFLADLPEAVVERINPRPPKPKPKQLSLL